MLWAVVVEDALAAEASGQGGEGLPHDYPEAQMELRWKGAGWGPEREGRLSLYRRSSFHETCFDHPGASETPWLGS